MYTIPGCVVPRMLVAVEFVEFAVVALVSVTTVVSVLAVDSELLVAPLVDASVVAAVDAAVDSAVELLWQFTDATKKLKKIYIYMYIKDRTAYRL